MHRRLAVLALTVLTSSIVACGSPGDDPTGSRTFAVESDTNGWHEAGVTLDTNGWHEAAPPEPDAFVPEPDAGVPPPHKCCCWGHGGHKNCCCWQGTKLCCYKKLKQCWWSKGKQHCKTVNQKVCVKLDKHTGLPAWLKCLPKKACGSH